MPLSGLTNLAARDGADQAEAGEQHRPTLRLGNGGDRSHQNLAAGVELRVVELGAGRQRQVAGVDCAECAALAAPVEQIKTLPGLRDKAVP